MRIAVLAAALVSVPVLGSAQGEDAGRREYVNSCAVCHGDSGRGDGPIVASLKTPPTDLTTLQKNNMGVFPFLAAFTKSLTAEIQLRPTDRATCPCTEPRFNNVQRRDSGIGAKI